MGARVRENKVDLIVSLEDFYRRVGAVHNYYELEWLGLTGHDFCGVFVGQLLPLLLTFCDENPEYHIVSSVGVGHFVNRLVHEGDFHMIARGDRDPAIELNFLLDPQWPLIYEEGMAAAFAEINHIKNSRKS